MEKLRILVIDDKAGERQKAKEAIEAAGHEADVYSSLPSFKKIAKADGVITDLFFDPNVYGAQYCDQEAMPPTGLIVALHCLNIGKPVAICTDADHHGPEASFIFHAYYASEDFHETYYEAHPEAKDQDPSYDEMIGFGWEDRKNWKYAVRYIEEKLS